MDTIDETKTLTPDYTNNSEELKSPLISSSCIKSAEILSSYIRPDTDISIPIQILTLLQNSLLDPVFLLQSNTQSTKQPFDLLIALIKLILVLSKDDPKKTREVWVKILNLLLKVSSPSRYHFEVVYESIACSLVDLNKLKDTPQFFNHILYALHLLKEMLSSPKILPNEPLSYFYVMGDTPKLSTFIPPKTPWPFTSGFTIIMWIRVINCSAHSLPILMRMRSSDKGFECYLKDHIITYRTLPAQYSPPCNTLLNLSFKQQWSRNW